MESKKVNLDIETNTDEVEKGFSSIRQELKKATLDLIEAQKEYGNYSKEALDAAKSVAVLKDRIAEANETANLFNPGKKLEVVAGAASQVANGFSVVQSAMILTGVESENLQEQLVKINALMALTQGLSGLADAGKHFQRFGTLASAQFTKLKVAIGSTGIGLIIIAAATLWANFDKIKEVIQDIIPGIEDWDATMNDLKQTFMGVVNVFKNLLTNYIPALIKVLKGDFRGAFDSFKKAFDVKAAFIEGKNKEIEAQARKHADEMLKISIDQLEREKTLMEAAGKDTTDILLRINREKQRLYRDDSDELRKLQLEEQVILIKRNKQQEEAAQKTRELYQKLSTDITSFLEDTRQSFTDMSKETDYIKFLENIPKKIKSFDDQVASLNTQIDTLTDSISKVGDSDGKKAGLIETLKRYRDEIGKTRVEFSLSVKGILDNLETLFTTNVESQKKYSDTLRTISKDTLISIKAQSMGLDSVSSGVEANIQRLKNAWEAGKLLEEYEGLDVVIENLKIRLKSLNKESSTYRAILSEIQVLEIQRDDLYKKSTSIQDTSILETRIKKQEILNKLRQKEFDLETEYMEIKEDFLGLLQREKEVLDNNTRARLEGLNQLEKEITDDFQLQKSRAEAQGLEVSKHAQTQYNDTLSLILKERYLIEKEHAVRSLYNIKKTEEEKSRIQWEQSQIRVDNARLAANAMSSLGALAMKDAQSSKELNSAVALVETYASAQSAYQSQFKPVALVDSPIRAKIAAATAIAAGLARVKAINSVSIPGGGGSTPSTPVAPQFNVVGDSQTNQLATAIGGATDKPVRAFVVSSDLTSSASLERNKLKTSIFI